MFFILLFVLAGCPVSLAKVALPSIFGNNMVLQRDSQVLLWGWGSPNEEVTIVSSWDGKTVSIKTDNAANWKIDLTTPQAGGPYMITIKGSNNVISLNNILIGEVWLCSGQSNMEWSANSGIDNAQEEIANANYANIRLFSVDKRTASSPQDDLSGSWEECTPESMKNFSAVAYFFARRLQEKMNIPIGLIDSSWGATCAEVWTPEIVFETHQDLRKEAEKIGPNQWVTTEPTVLYNAMIAPITPFKIGGTIWYQGESNTANADTYAELLTAMIGSWREKWGYEFPFYFVQIAPFNYGTPEQGVVVRNEQRKAMDFPKTGMVVISDYCTVDDIHPKNKQVVGLRLANLALNHTYKIGNDEVYGPLFKEIKVNGKKIEVSFDHADGMYFKGKGPTQFEVAAKSGPFYPAKAIIKDNKVILSAKEIAEPARMRYAWSNTAMPNLFNGADLPASSFISD
jgi:sialate O-acetylesterase